MFLNVLLCLIVTTGIMLLNKLQILNSYTLWNQPMKPLDNYILRDVLLFVTCFIKVSRQIKGKPVTTA